MSAAVCLFTAFAASPASENNIRTKGLTKEIVKRLDRQKEKEVNLNEEVLELSFRVTEDLATGGEGLKDATVYLDYLVDELGRRTAAETDDVRKIQEINYFLFEEQGFKVDPSPLFRSSLDSILINVVLTRRVGDRLSVSLLYLLLAERLGLPLYGVHVPAHFFVRYKKDDVLLNIDPYESGRSYVNEYYTNKYSHGFDDGARDRTLGKKETLGLFLGSLAHHYRRAGNSAWAVDLFSMALKMGPPSVELHTYYAQALEYRNKMRKAIKEYKRALEINPYACIARHNLGLAELMYMRDFEGARENGMIARALGCDMHPAYEMFLNGARQ